jgi:segregation and condensation protein B
MSGDDEIRPEPEPTDAAPGPAPEPTTTAPEPTDAAPGPAPEPTMPAPEPADAAPEQPTIAAVSALDVLDELDELSELGGREEPDDGEAPGEEADEEYQAQVHSIATEEMLLSRIESLVFVYPEPITVRRLARILCLDGKRVRELLRRLMAVYESRGIVLSEVSGGFQFHTHPDNAPIVRAAIKVKPMRMSRPALETLAIVAYRQPITRAEIEEIRRVDSGGTLKFLFEKSLVRVLGRKEEPGRPMIYGTTTEFLALFSLKSLNDLPSLHEFTELWDEHREIVEEQEIEVGGPPRPAGGDKPEPFQS